MAELELPKKKLGAFTYGYKQMNLIKKCPVCKKKTEHKESGFREHNYRLACKECGTINYPEYD